MIRRAKKEDAENIAPLILIILKDMDLPIFSAVSEKKILECLCMGIQEETYRYSYKNTIVYEIENNIGGFLTGYKGEKVDVLDENWKNIANKLNIDYKKPLFKDKETFKGEWYLDSITVDIKYRGLGIATKMLKKIPELALNDNENIIGLNCEKTNMKAYNLYTKMGFYKTEEITLNNHIYYHMQIEAKNLNM